jgi:phosphatidylserine decarboxylase
MKYRTFFSKFLLQEDLNFLLTNRIPRRTLTLFMGSFSKIENPVIRFFSIATWRIFSAVDLSDASQSQFKSLHDAFIRSLKPGSRTVFPGRNTLVSPCDGIIGAHGRIENTMVFQAKGFPYSLRDLLPNETLAKEFAAGSYVTIRITAGMYHRFHAPIDCNISKVTYISGDTWNVNPIALKRVEKLFCKNERAVIESTFVGPGSKKPHRFLMIPVAAVLVASIRLHFINVLLNLRYKGANIIECNANYSKGDELGWFEHGSTIILIAPPEFKFVENISEGASIRMGEALMTIND